MPRPGTLTVAQHEGPVQEHAPVARQRGHADGELEAQRQLLEVMLHHGVVRRVPEVRRARVRPRRGLAAGTARRGRRRTGSAAAAEYSGRAPGSRPPWGRRGSEAAPWAARPPPGPTRCGCRTRPERMASLGVDDARQAHVTHARHTRRGCSAFTGRGGQRRHTCPPGAPDRADRPPRFTDTVSEGPITCSGPAPTPSPGADRPAKPRWRFDVTGRLLKVPLHPTVGLQRVAPQRQRHVARARRRVVVRQRQVPIVRVERGEAHHARGRHERHAARIRRSRARDEARRGRRHHHAPGSGRPVSSSVTTTRTCPTATSRAAPSRSRGSGVAHPRLHRLRGRRRRRQRERGARPRARRPPPPSAAAAQVMPSLSTTGLPARVAHRHVEAHRCALRCRSRSPASPGTRPPTPTLGGATHLPSRHTCAPQSASREHSDGTHLPVSHWQPSGLLSHSVERERAPPRRASSPRACGTRPRTATPAVLQKKSAGSGQS